jgi:hypothetical protein
VISEYNDECSTRVTVMSTVISEYGDEKCSTGVTVIDTKQIGLKGECRSNTSYGLKGECNKKEQGSRGMPMD